ncbi:ABC transporter permease [Chiayiivirga flava]|uniref:Putative permease n=1 Tax=Chiayiivirga flava TaxID=659595 RepID=A0A7W8D629_9GAMM|nr:ABC transporter permease [Chiayiivirga flava]MBB5206943.1 putative permease [Chiayiivirga flava]
MLTTFLQELRYSLRTLMAQPMFTLIAVATLALGIGANTAIFSVIDGLYLRDMPYKDGDRLAIVHNTYPKMGLEDAGTSIPDYFDRKTQAPSIEDIAIYNNVGFNLADAGAAPERLVALRTSASLFSTLQVQPALGRVFSEENEAPGADRVIVLSHALWENRFNADPAIVGRDIRLDAQPYRVLAVMPEGFDFPNRNVGAWVPFAFTPELKSANERGNEYSSSVARLAPGATLEKVDAEMAQIVRTNVEQLGPDIAGFVGATGFTGRARWLREYQVGETRTMLLVLQGAVLMVLLIACANVANLMLTRVVARQKEISVRNALGATRWRIARQLLVDALVLATIGGGLGLLLAKGSIAGFPLLGITSNQSGYDFRMDAPVLGFALLVTIVAAGLAAILPMISLLRLNIYDTIKEGGRLGSGGRRAAASRNVLVVAQIALATTLLIGAGLLLKSFHLLQSQDPGFRSDGVATALIDLPETKYVDGAAQARALEQIVDRLETIPGVQSAAYTSTLPFSGNNSSGSYSIEGLEVAEGTSPPHAMQRQVEGDYFGTMGIALKRGRLFDARDRADGAPVVIIDEFMAERYFPGQDPLGKRVRRGSSDPDADLPWATIVGVVGTIKHGRLGENVEKETIYWPVAQAPQSSGALVVKANVPPQTLNAAIREAVLAFDPEQSLFGVQTLDERISRSLNNQRAPMVLLGIFAVVALVLSAIGIYGVLAYSVGQRTGELGVRMAIGAGRSQILALILRHGAWLTGIGLGLGLVGAFAGGQAMRTQLFGVGGADPVIFLLVPVLLAAIALFSCWLPARRATRIDPLVALRHE